MRACLERALGYLARAMTIWPQFTEIVYHQAKCHALLGQVQDAQQKLEILSDRDRRYFAKASQDGDFRTFHASVEKLFRRAVAHPGPLARATQAKLDEVGEAIAWAKRSAPASKEDLAAIESIELGGLPDARRSLPTLSVDIEGLSERLSRMLAFLEKITQRALQRNIDASQMDVKAQEALKGQLEPSIEGLKRTIKATEGTGVGWLSAFLAGVVVIPVTKMLEQQFHEPLTSFFVVACCALGFFVGARISIGIKSEPLKRKVEEHVRSVDECIRSLPLLQQQVEYRKQEMHSFGAWQAQRRAPTLAPLGSS